MATQEQYSTTQYTNEAEKRFWEYEQIEQLTCGPFLQLVNNAETNEELENRELQFMSCMLEETNPATTTCLPNLAQKSKRYRNTHNKDLLAIDNHDIDKINECVDNDPVTSNAFAELGNQLETLTQTSSIFGQFVDLTRKGRRDLNILPDDSADSIYNKITETMFTVCKPYLNAAEKCAHQAKQQKNDPEFIREACFKEMQLMKYCQASTLCRQQTRQCIIAGIYDKELNHLNEEGLFYQCQRTDPDVLECISQIYGETPNIDKQKSYFKQKNE